MKSIGMLGTFLLALVVTGCQMALIGERPVPYQGTSMTLVLAETYSWTAGFARVKHELPHGTYVATLMDRNGLYYVQEGSSTGIYVAKNRSVVYGFSLKTPEEEAEAARILRPGTFLVAKGIGLEPGVGKVDTQIIIRGDWRKAFKFND